MPTDPPFPEHRRRRWVLATLLFVAGAASWRFISPLTLGARARTAAPQPVATRGELGADERQTIALFEAASPSVVFITTTELRRDLWSMRVYETRRGSGSGFIWDDRGHVVTNYHVIANSDRARVTLADQTTWDAEVVGAEPDKDLAVLRIEAPRDAIRPLPIGASGDLAVGQKVLAIGNPFGLDQTLTTGIISALGREIQSITRRPIKDVIQTDAAINPGNSGGPLLDSAGRLIGVNTAIYSPSGAYAGIGFAVPVDTVNRIVPQLVEHGRVIRPGFGVNIYPDSVVRDLARSYRIYRQGGVLIQEVVRGSAADRAGMRGTRSDFRGRRQLGDLIIALDGERVRNTNDLFQLLDRHRVGDTVTVTVLRGDRELDLRVELQGV